MLTRLQLAAVAAVVLLLAIGGFIAYERHQGALAQKAKTEAAQGQADVSGAEAQGAAQTAQRVDVVVTQRDNLDRGVTRYTEAARRADDADAPIDPARLARLRAADSELCSRPGGCTTH